MDAKDENITKSFRNLPKVKYLLVDYLNPYDLMHSDKVVFLESAFKKINK
ncbi:50S ribosomal protein L4 [bacterium]|nr:50S ribosomal protein L4 [bacterium]